MSSIHLFTPFVTHSFIHSYCIDTAFHSFKHSFFLSSIHLNHFYHKSELLPVVLSNIWMLCIIWDGCNTFSGTYWEKQRNNTFVFNLLTLLMKEDTCEMECDVHFTNWFYNLQFRNCFRLKGYKLQHTRYRRLIITTKTSVYLRNLDHEICRDDFLWKNDVEIKR